MAGSGAKAAASGAFAATGFGSAFALASCCALPMGLAAIGLGSSWLVPLVMATEPHSTLLWGVALASIAFSVLLVALSARTCAPGDLCARRWFRFTIYGMAGLSVVLLIVGYIYG